MLDQVGLPDTVEDASDNVFAPIVNVPPIVRLVSVPRLVMLGWAAVLSVIA